MGEAWPEGVPSWEAQREAVAAGAAAWADYPAKWRAPHSAQAAPRVKPPNACKLERPPAPPPAPAGGGAPAQPGTVDSHGPISGEVARSGARAGLRAARAALPAQAARRGSGGANKPQPASRYCTVVTDGSGLHAPSGRFQELGAEAGDAGRLLRAARRFAGSAEPVVWLAPEAVARFELGAAPPADELPPWLTDAGRPLRRWGSAHTGWWWGLEEPPHPAALLAVAPWGDFAGASSAPELLEALAAWEGAVGHPFTFSGTSVVGELIRSDHGRRRLRAPEPEPVLEPEPWRECAWAVPGHQWYRAPARWELEERPWVRAFDRNACYLAAWSGLNVGDGPWSEGWLRCEGGPDHPETTKPSGYWLLELGPLRAWLADYGLPDPFARHGSYFGEETRDAGALEWYTTPLAQLAGDVAWEAGLEVRCERVWWQLEQWRPLDNVATRLRDARAELLGRGDGAGELARGALREAYAGATARFRWLAEHGKADDRLARPYWSAAIRDRATANTWRGLERCAEPPLCAARIDAAAWCVQVPDAVPGGLRVGAGMGQWKPAGGALELGRALEVLEAGGAPALLRELERC